MRGIKIPQYEFALKMQGEFMREGGRICGTLRYIHYLHVECVLLFLVCDRDRHGSQSVTSCSPLI